MNEVNPTSSNVEEDQAFAPWSEEQVGSLNGFQACGFFHEFTCGNHHTGRDRVLIATPEGWKCPSCSYTQDWAWKFMSEGKWRDSAQTFKNMFGERAITDESLTAEAKTLGSSEESSTTI